MHIFHPSDVIVTVLRFNANIRSKTCTKTNVSDVDSTHDKSCLISQKGGAIWSVHFSYNLNTDYNCVNLKI